MIYLAADHAGFELKEKIKEHLKSKGFVVDDKGALSFDKDDDYPDLIAPVAKAVSEDPEKSKGILFGGSGQAEMMVANKFKGVRCALFYAAVPPLGAADVTGRISSDPFEMIRLTREHNNANMLSIGARFVSAETAKKVVDLWLSQDFPGDVRHVRRIKKISEFENG